ncbi:MAG: Asp-tRNA(Asn)/Glu-tRNA(Gln) amidotransferase subunit GatA [Myxococcales bacterium]|nr:Asp-tRNA(Asn)/Glu-tRNA(Gln) amidotransferase subunit GatA [Myxococcales bacterium]
MSDLCHLSLVEQARRVAVGGATARELVDAHLARIDALDPRVHAFLHVDRDGARAAAEQIDARRSRGDKLGPLAGVPIGIKDVVVTKGQPTTAASRMLAGWTPPYDAAVVERLRAADAILIGKQNCDEFGMGSSTENSAQGPTRNPWDLERIPGGSSGGSAAAVAAGFCAASIGTDTGGSIRQPSSMCGVVGLKPTYGRVSRWGLIAYASSLDQIGPMTRTVEDAALLLELIAGHDPRDSTSLVDAVPKYRSKLTSGVVAGTKIGLPAEYFGDGIDPAVRAVLDRTISVMRDAGARFVSLSLPHTRLALPTYYLLACAEASSNLSRYDGIRYGQRVERKGASLADVYRDSRSAGFGAEVKRRIMLGTFALRAGYYDAYYRKAQQVRALIKRDFDEAFAQVDVLLTPTAPTAAFGIGETTTPMEMYLGDVFTLACNLAGLPGLSVPVGLTPAGLPVGAQLLGKPLDELTLLKAGRALEQRCELSPRWPDLGEVEGAS